MEDISGLNYKVCCTRYQEDISWILPFTPNVSIQNSGDASTIPNLLHSHTQQVPNIPGIGQLDFIIKNYDSLPDIVVFVNATFSKEQVIDYIKQVHLFGHTTNATAYISNGVLAHDAMPIEMSADDTVRFHTAFNDWFCKNVTTEPETGAFMWFKGAMFGVSKAFILSRSKQYYENLLGAIVAGNEPEVILYLERSWFYMLNLDKLALPGFYESAFKTHSHIFKRLDEIIVESGQQLVEGSLFFYGAFDLHYNDTFVHKQVNLFNLAKNAKYILEIGFNAGHSTALMLLANPSSKILHFDLCEHAYGKRCYEFLKSVFGPERFIELVGGDSRSTVPAYKQTVADMGIQFDLIHIDGGHTDLVAMSDISHCKDYACKDNIVVVDDYNADNIKRLTDQCVMRGMITPYTGIVADHDGSMYHYIGSYTGV